MELKKQLKGLIANIYRLTLSVFYSIFIVPMGWWVRKTKDPLGVKKIESVDSTQSLWLERKPSDTKLNDAKRQY